LPQAPVAPAPAAPAPAPAGPKESSDLVDVPHIPRNLRDREKIEKRIHDSELRVAITTVPTLDPSKRGVLLQCPHRGVKVPRGETVHVVLGISTEGREEGRIGEEVRDIEGAEGMD
jgi:hypothetical protein